MRDTKRGFESISLMYACVVFLPILATVAFFRVVTLDVPTGLRTGVPFAVYGASSWIVIILGRVALKKRTLGWKDVGFTRFKARELLYGFIGALIGIFLVYPLSAFIVAKTGIPPMKGMGYQLSSLPEIVFLVVLNVFVVTLAEDILFRGYLLSHTLAKTKHRVVTAAIGVVVFSVVHIPYFSWGGLVFIALWSPITVALYLWRKNIYASYFMHVVNNAFAYIAVPLLFTAS